MGDTSVVSVKVPAEVLQEVRRSKKDIDWPDELRQFILERLRQWRSEQILSEVHGRLSRSAPRPRGFAATLLREDRDHH
ncbi:MAG TPA: CopG family transcriptional regulator [Thermoplasmata archaeon]|nr:CopG family transcriptional regulator [Thermoplasmata archaeon]